MRIHQFSRSLRGSFCMLISLSHEWRSGTPMTRGEVKKKAPPSNDDRFYGWINQIESAPSFSSCRLNCHTLCVSKAIPPLYPQGRQCNRIPQPGNETHQEKFIRRGIASRSPCFGVRCMCKHAHPRFCFNGFDFHEWVSSPWRREWTQPGFTLCESIFIINLCGRLIMISYFDWQIIAITDLYLLKYFVCEIAMWPTKDYDLILFIKCFESYLIFI